VGTSASRGPFITNQATRAAVGDGDGDKFTQAAWGGDVEYSRDYYLVRAETIFTQWTLPNIRAPFIDKPLGAWATSIEGRYKLYPGVYAAARVDRLVFSEVTGSTGPQPWDAPVTRVEVGGGYSIQRNLIVKLSYQFNKRDTIRRPRASLAAAEIVFWL
jgi:hypothetical protein